MTVIDITPYLDRKREAVDAVSRAHMPPTPLPKNCIVVVPQCDGTHAIWLLGRYRRDRLHTINTLAEIIGSLSDMDSPDPLG